MYARDEGARCKSNLIDFQHRYILCMLLSLRKRGIGFVDDGFGFAEDATNWKVLYEKLQKASTVGISLMVVDGLTEKTKSTLQKAYTPLLLQSKRESFTHVAREYCTLVLLNRFADWCSETYVYKERLLPLTEAAVLPAAYTSIPTEPSPEKEAAGPSKTHKLGWSDESDSDSDVVVLEQAPAGGAEKGKKKHKEAEEDEDEMSDSGSDDGSNSESEEDESDEQEDSESEDESDDDEPKKKKPKTMPTAAAPTTTPSGTAKSPRVNSASTRVAEAAFTPDPEDDVHQRKGATGPKTEKEKRKPAKLRRMSLEKQIVGILRQGKGLDDAVPAQNQDKLSARIEDVEKTLHPFVEEGKVADVHELLLASWGLVSELFTIVNAIGRAGGPAPPDSAVSRRLALNMTRLYESECQDVEDLASDLARLANKMASMVANRAQAAMQGDRDSQQLVAHGVPAYYGI